MKKTMFPRDFVEWMVRDSCEYYESEEDAEENYYYSDMNGNNVTLDGIYYYWLTEIKDKQ